MENILPCETLPLLTSCSFPSNQKAHLLSEEVVALAVGVLVEQVGLMGAVLRRGGVPRKAVGLVLRAG